jgi:hypothetical protein
MPQVDRAYAGVERGGSVMEFEPANWKPLEIRIGARCAEFIWMWRQNGLEYYKHIDKRRYLILDSEGQSYRQQDAGLVAVDFTEEFRRVAEAIDV